MGFLLTFFISLALQIVGELLRPKQEPTAPKPSSLGDFSFPTAQEGRVVPVFWGTVKISGPNVVWYGDLNVDPIKKEQKTGLFSSTDVTIGYRYTLGMQLALAHGGLDEFIDLKFDGKSVKRVNETDHGDYISFDMDSPELFGKPDQEGGVTGPVKIYKGNFTQPANAYLRTQFGEPSIPAYRPVIHAVFEHCYLGNRNTVSAVEFYFRRCPNPLGLIDGMHNIDGDANPMNMIYEIMTNRVWGEGIPSTLIDTANFISVAETLYNEGLGLSMQSDSAQKAEDLTADILRHIDGIRYPNPQTGLYEIKLARKDYVVDDLMLVDESNVLELSSYKRGSWSETQNTVQVSYIDRSQDYTQRSLQQQNLANISIRDGQIEVGQFDFLGISKRSVINNQIIPRLLKTVSSPLASITIKMNRDGEKLLPGGVFRFAWSKLGITQQVYRITDIDYGTLNSPEVEISAVEDIFAVNAVAYAVPPPSGWVDPKKDPQPLAFERLEEIPYGLLDAEQIRAMTLGSRAGGQEVGYRVYSDSGVGDPLEQTNDIVGQFTPSAALVADLPLDTGDGGSFSVEASIDISDVSSVTLSERDAGRALLLVNNEWIAFQTITDNGDGTHTLGNVLRGVLDTIPADHAAGSRVFFATSGVGLTQPEPFNAPGIVEAKLLPYTPLKTLPEADAALLSLTTVGRTVKPYPPGQVRINGLRRPAAVSGSSVLIEWAHRNRLSQGTDIFGADYGDIAVEDGVKYTVRVEDDSGNPLIDTTVTGTSFEYALNPESPDTGDGFKFYPSDPYKAQLQQNVISIENNGRKISYFGIPESFQTHLMIQEDVFVYPTDFPQDWLNNPTQAYDLDVQASTFADSTVDQGELEIDFGRGLACRGLLVFHPSSSGTTSWNYSRKVIQISPNGQNWETIWDTDIHGMFTDDEDLNTGHEFIFGSEKTIRFVRSRLVVDGTAGFPIWAEINPLISGFWQDMGSQMLATNDKAYAEWIFRAADEQDNAQPGVRLLEQQSGSTDPKETYQFYDASSGEVKIYGPATGDSTTSVQPPLDGVESRSVFVGFYDHTDVIGVAIREYPQTSSDPYRLVTEWYVNGNLLAEIDNVGTAYELSFPLSFAELVTRIRPKGAIEVNDTGPFQFLPTSYTSWTGGWSSTLTDSITVILGSIRDGEASLQKHQFTISISGWGLNWGENYGGS